MLLIVEKAAISLIGKKQLTQAVDKGGKEHTTNQQEDGKKLQGTPGSAQYVALSP